MTTVRVFNKALHVMMHTSAHGSAAGRCEAATNSHFHPSQPKRFVTCGGDRKVNVWNVDDTKRLGLSRLAVMDAHDAPVNVAKWSPDGRFLATAGDDAIIIVWEFDLENTTRMARAFGSSAQDENLPEQGYWRRKGALRSGALGQEISDIAWDPTGKYIVACSPHGKAIVFNVNYSQEVVRFPPGKHTAGTFFQGVDWAPDGRHIAIQTMDKGIRIYMRQDKKKCIHFRPVAGSSRQQPGVISSAKIQKLVEKDGVKKLANRAIPLFSRNLVGQFKRPQFSPDGQFLLAVAGEVSRPESERSEDEAKEAGEGKENGGDENAESPAKKPAKARKDPAAHLFRLERPSAEVTTYAVKNNSKGTLGITACAFCPKVFKLKGPPQPGSPAERYGMPYRCFFALLARTSIYVYDTAHNHPLFWWQDVDIQEFLSLTWSSDGLSLIATDCEGFATQVRFNSADLGEEHKLAPFKMEWEAPAAAKSPKAAGKASGTTTLVPVKKKGKKGKSPPPGQKSIAKFFNPMVKKKAKQKAKPAPSPPPRPPQDTRSSNPLKGYFPALSKERSAALWDEMELAFQKERTAKPGKGKNKRPSPPAPQPDDGVATLVPVSKKRKTAAVARPGSPGSADDDVVMLVPVRKKKPPETQ